MKRLNIKVVTILLSLFFLIKTNAQNCTPMNGKITILDSLVEKEYKDETIRLTIRLDVTPKDSVYLYHFNRFVNSSPAFHALMKRGSNPKNSGLIYVIENEEGSYVDTWIRPAMVSYENVEDEVRYYSSRWVVDTINMNVDFKYFEDNAIRKDFDMAILPVKGGCANLCIFPMMLNSGITVRETLKPGRYKLFLYYSMQEITGLLLDNSQIPVDRVFLGTMISNKIDLIVKDRPSRWWEFWRRRIK